ncbi:hypothetical protein Tco_1228192 [Tanacetum coccineum]
METHKPLLKDADGEDVDEHLYRSMIGSLMYLTSSRPNIMFAGNCVNMQRIIHKGWLEWNAKDAKDGIGVKTGNLRVNAVGHYLVLLGGKVNDVYDTPSHNKQIFANMRRKGKDFLGTVTPLFSSMLAQQADIGEGSGQPTDPQHTSTSAQPSNKEPITVPSSSQPKKTHRPRKAKRATEISQSSRSISLVADETVTKEREDRMERAATTASSLEAE